MTLEQEADFCFFHTIFSMVFQANQFLTSLWVLLTGLCGWVEGQATNEQPWASILYTAVVRGKVALPCDISPPSADDSVALILWYKDEAPTPIYTLDARYGKIEQARQSSSSELENRAYFNMINRPAFLQLDPVEEDDSGEYRCRVDFHTARTVNTVISLKVIVPPSKPVIKDSSGKQVKGLIGPYNEGESLVLTCEAEGGKPRPSVTWWRDYLLVDDTYTYDSGDTIVRNDLTIEKLRREDLLVVLTCQAINNNITVSASSYITLDLNLKPSTVEVQPKQRPLSAGKETEYTCVTSGARPKVVIAWWKGSEQIKTETPSDDSSSTIVFTPTIEDDGKYFYCRVYNPLIPSSALEDGWKLEIHYRPQVTLQIGKTLQRKHLQEGDDVHLECHIRSNPWINNIQWYFNGSELHNDIMAGIVISNQSLVLEKVQRTNRGIYSCSAKNQEGGGHSNDVYLPIRCKPRPSVTWWRDYLLVDDTYTYDSGDTIVRNDLTIEKLRREDLLVVLTCQAINNNITVSASSYITLDLNLKPSTVEVQPKQRPLSAGKETEYTCVTSGARPKVVIAWWKGSEQIKTETPSDDSSSTIVFTPTIEDDGKYFYCRVYNPLIPSSALEDGWKLEIHYRPQVTLQIGKTLQRKHLQEGDDVHLECHIRSNPWINNIQWYFNGSELHNDIMAGIVISNQSLVLEKVQRTNRGIYSCSAKNQEGGGHSNDVYLPIRYRPQVTLQIGKTLQRKHLQEGDDVHLECHIRSNPWINNIQWYFNGSELHNDIMAGIVISNQSLVLEKVQRTNRGIYSCSAKNQEGGGHSNDVYLPIRYAPVCSSSKTVYGVSLNEAVRVVCEVDADPNDVTFYWMFNNSARVMEIVAFTKEGMRSVTTYTPRTDDDYGSLICQAKNNVGIQHESCNFSIIPAGKYLFSKLIYTRRSFPFNINAPVCSSSKTVYGVSLNEAVRVVCEVDADPNDVTFYWMFNNSARVMEIVAFTKEGMRSVTTYTPRTDDDYGSLICQAKNNVGIQHESCNFSIIPADAPVCSSSKTVYGVSLNEAVRVVCEVDADPNDVTFYWMFNNSARVMEIVAFTKEGMRSVTTYTPRTDDDYGSLICQAKNNVGIQHESCNFSIIPAAPPDIVQNCTVLNETEESLLIDCIEGYDGGLMQIFNIEIYDELLSRLQMNTTSVHPFFQLHGLSSGRTYRIMIYSVNSKGKSIPYYLSASTLQRAAKLTGKITSINVC
ncbi:hemicentin-2-like [Centruroides sculpturatus]|uniref:hemicentin-2-like n=1 Tax=Centruroides sculpturatus TaxID=218467 RepID=UPI000C6CFA23|nr:hemicentin-2-like [Centruroides sculpturatus]